MTYSQDYSDRFAALETNLTPAEMKSDALIATAALEKVAGFLWALSSQGGDDDESAQEWQQEADKILEVADRLNFGIIQG